MAAKKEDRKSIDVTFDLWRGDRREQIHMAGEGFVLNFTPKDTAYRHLHNLLKEAGK